ncbi:N-acetylmuramoyl-L-alanine amidase [Cytobacillus suaedae]|nr:N-acetylmuramoyl-L-alanine amidase [Cytobacillus suaedae]
MSKKLLFLALFIFFLFPVTYYAEKTVIIDVGHGGKYSGTCGYSGSATGFCEKDANLLVALKLQEILKPTDIKVHLTRTTDMEFAPYLKKDDGTTDGGDFDVRMKMANAFAENNNNHSIFISIHHNAHPTNPFRRGIETYYYDGVKHGKTEYPHDPFQIKYLSENKRLAEVVHPILVDSLRLPDRKIHSDQSFYVIRNAQMPSILVELGYMINRHEEKLIKTESYQEEAARALAKGIEAYFAVFEVYGSNNERLATFSNEIDALRYAFSINSAISVFDKKRQKTIYEKDSFNYILKPW